ncbi:MAG: cupin domain-containing protein [Clostridium sp.]|uniref:cupin domain-containing protein n=1 Tax=Clostridium sp. TaxID=1506 RepID=UPI00304FF93F
MEKIKNLLNNSLNQYGDKAVPKVPVFVGTDITSEVYFFKPNQILNKHRHPSGDQIFVILKGKGKMMVGDGAYDICEGSTVFVPAGEWHEIINGTECEMAAVQVTKSGAGFEPHQ